MNINIIDEDLLLFMKVKHDAAFIVPEIYAFKYIAGKCGASIIKPQLFDFECIEDNGSTVYEVKYNKLNLSKEQLVGAYELLRRGKRFILISNIYSDSKYKIIDSYNCVLGTFYCYDVSLKDIDTEYVIRFKRNRTIIEKQLSQLAREILRELAGLKR